MAYAVNLNVLLVGLLQKGRGQRRTHDSIKPTDLLGIRAGLIRLGGQSVTGSGESGADTCVGVLGDRLCRRCSGQTVVE